MKCFYTIDPKTLKKVLIPMCIGTSNSYDVKDCSCPDPLTDHQFEKERFNKIVEEKNKSIESMQAEIDNLNRIIQMHKINNP